MKGRSRRHLFALWRKPGSFSGLYKPLLLFTKQDTVMWFMCLDSVARRKRSAEAKAKGNESEREGRRTRRWRRKWENGCWHVHVPITEKERRAQREREKEMAWWLFRAISHRILLGRGEGAFLRSWYIPREPRSQEPLYATLFMGLFPYYFGRKIEEQGSRKNESEFHFSSWKSDPRTICLLNYAEGSRAKSVLYRCFYVFRAT